MLSYGVIPPYSDRSFYRSLIPTPGPSLPFQANDSDCAASSSCIPPMGPLNSGFGRNVRSRIRISTILSELSESLRTPATRAIGGPKLGPCETPPTAPSRRSRTKSHSLKSRRAVGRSMILSSPFAPLPRPHGR
ncbi:hypothetical protein N7488_001520 [Penicillium malachiteum]|nr:hypothetical protein N7488_001520 [Penicillium malachiteum]